MDFNLTDTQRMLEDSAERFIRDRYSPEQRRAMTGCSDDNWAMIVEMGWLALPFAEDVGGLGGGMADLCVLMRTLGAGLVIEPVLRTLQAGWLLEGRDDALLADVIAGQARVTVADGSRISVQKGELSGTLPVVPDPGATQIILLAKGQLWLAQPDFSQPYCMIDGSIAADATLNGPARLLGPDEGAFAMAEDRARLLGAAYLVGTMQSTYELTRDYAATRAQFGTKLDENQVIRHRLADLSMMAQESRALIEFAAMQVDDDPAMLAPMAAACMARIGRDATRATADGVQLHGGIGMTDDYPVGHYYKAAMAYDALFGGTAKQLRRYAEMERPNE